jgi:hypothetical protein
MTLQTVVELGDAREGEEDPLWHTAGSRQPQAKRTARLEPPPAKAPRQAPPAIGAASSSHGLAAKRPAGGTPPPSWQ